eukprot:GDKI01043342.1.p1 GENE.GDKI01043342.1~~GDKI01043342.1.p1  ORF type:complete len:171 (-),score=42.90 GDKI01043342.1:58-513(-)
MSETEESSRTAVMNALSESGQPNEMSVNDGLSEKPDDAKTEGGKTDGAEDEDDDEDGDGEDAPEEPARVIDFNSEEYRLECQQAYANKKMWEFGLDEQMKKVKLGKGAGKAKKKKGGVVEVLDFENTCPQSLYLLPEHILVKKAGKKGKKK